MAYLNEIGGKIMKKKYTKEEMDKNKFILDACCGGRMMWFNKNHPNTLYIDNRKESKGHISKKSNHKICPDEVMDFRDLKFPDKSFKLVVWDPPHSYDLGQGFKECWRVLQDYGVLIFKWNEKQIKLKSILRLFPGMMIKQIEKLTFNVIKDLTLRGHNLKQILSDLNVDYVSFNFLNGVQ